MCNSANIRRCVCYNQLSSGVGEVRSAKRGAISVHFLPETNGLGGLKDR
jgi:hypothetical protein